MKKKSKIILFSILGFILTIGLVVTIPFMVLDIKTGNMSTGYAYLKEDNTYKEKVEITDLELVTQHVSCGYASIEMISKYYKRSYLKYDQLLKEIHGSIKKKNPVAIEWAAKYENEWTLHFSVVSGLDLVNDNVTVYNPYGYIENVTINDFLNRTTFKAYKNMPLFLDFGFAFGAFHKNTIFYAE